MYSHIGMYVVLVLLVLLRLKKKVRAAFVTLVDRVVSLNKCIAGWLLAACCFCFLFPFPIISSHFI